MTARVLLVALVVLVVLNGQQVMLGAVHVSQHALSPLATHLGIRCRFTPTCSRYAEAVIRKDGVLRGGWRAIKRVANCNPMTSIGTRDEP